MAPGGDAASGGDSSQEHQRQQREQQEFLAEQLGASQSQSQSHSQQSQHSHSQAMAADADDFDGDNDDAGVRSEKEALAHAVSDHAAGQAVATVGASYGESVTVSSLTAGSSPSIHRVCIAMKIVGLVGLLVCSCFVGLL